MKQLMVLVATIILGITISGTVLGFGDSVDDISGDVSTGITNLGTAFTTEMNAGLTEAGATTVTN